MTFKYITKNILQLSISNFSLLQNIDKFINEEKFSTDSFIEKLVKAKMLYGFPTKALYFNIGTPQIIHNAELNWKKERTDKKISLRRIKQWNI